MPKQPMDPLSLSCNIIGVLTAAGQLISAGYSYGSSLKEFPEAIRGLVEELSSLSGILHALQVIIGPHEVNNDDVTTRPDLGGVARAIAVPLEDCGRMLSEMIGDLEKYQKAGNRVQKVVKRLTWPLKEDETKTWIEKIGRYKSTFTLALSADGVSLTRAICQNLEEIKIDQRREREEKRLAMEKERYQRIVKWLSAADPEPNHRAAQKLRQEGTGGWFTGGKAYQDWFNTNHSFLWLYGMPGSGKTILSSHIIDHLLAGTTNPNSKTAIVYFYCDFQDNIKQTTAGLLGSFLAQLLDQGAGPLDEVEKLFKKKGTKFDSSLVDGLQTLLPSFVSQFSKVLLVVDAIDECADRVSFLRGLQWIRGLENVSLLATSRNELDIKLEFEGLPFSAVKPDDTAADIEMYIVNEIERRPRLQRLRPDTKSQIIDSLTKQVKGMFRWAKCCLDQIAKLRSDKAIKAALLSLPKTLESTYERILCQIPVEDEEMAKRVLRWLIHNCGVSPMLIDQILEGIAVEIGKSAMDPENKLNEPEDILDICGGLVIMDDDGRRLRLAHFTVKEYLVSIVITQGPAASYHLPENTSNADLTKVCLTYLMFDEFEAGPCGTSKELQNRLEEFPLYYYASYWLPNHISKYHAGDPDDKTLDRLLLEFFLLDGDSGKFLAWTQVNVGLEYREAGTSPLTHAAFLGVNSAVREILKKGADVNALCDGHRTPLIAATVGGNDVAVKLLLENGADPNLENKHGRTTQFISCHSPIYSAALHGHAKCLQILLDYGADEIEDGIHYGNSLSGAVWQGHREIVEIFVKTKYFQSSSEDNPLFYTFYMCASSGFEKLARMLLEAGGDIIVSSKSDYLFHALRGITENGHHKVLQVILQRADTKAFCLKDDVFPRILQSAAYGGYEKVIELLVNSKKSFGSGDFGTALHIAAAQGHGKVLERLLQAGASPQDKDPEGWTPILYASQYQQEFCLEKLLKEVEDLEGLDLIDKIGPTGWEKKGTLPKLEISEDGLEVKNLSITPNGGATPVRAQHPATPLCDKFYFEIEIISCPPNHRIYIGFSDKLAENSMEAMSLWTSSPGTSTGSWGYMNNGCIWLQDSMSTLKAPPYGEGAIVGCCFDRISKTATFTLDGSRTGLSIADIKGQLIPMVALGSGIHIRANFGDEPFAYEAPDLSAEDISNAFRPSTRMDLTSFFTKA